MLKRGFVLMLILLCLVLSSCSLIPKEEEFDRAPTVQAVTPVEYTFANVQRGELVLIQTIGCTYTPIQMQDLAFATGGIRFSDVYAAKGDTVQAGDVLAELDLGQYPELMQNCQNTIARLEIQLSYAREALLLKETYWTEYRAGIDDEDDLEETPTVDEYCRQDRLNIQILENNLYVLYLKLDEYQAEMAKRQLIAPFDGTITYARTIDEGAYSTEGERIFRLVDTSNAVFIAETEYYEYFTPGDACTITVRLRNYDAVVIDPAQLGITPPNEQTVYMMLVQATANLENGDSGSVKIVLDRRDDCLYVPTQAVSEVDGRSAVYVPDENGLRSVAYVETGLAAGSYVEIISGLCEEDRVILD